MPPEPSRRAGSLLDDLLVKLQRAADRLGVIFSNFHANNFRHVLHRARRWFGGLAPIAKAVVVGLALLTLLILLSPVSSVVAVLTFGVSLIVLIVRIAQRRSVVGWGITAVASLVLALVLSGVAGVLYGGGETADTESNGQGRTPKDSGTQREPVPAYGDVAPGLDGLADRWASSYIKSPLFVPSTLPYAPSEVGANITDSGFGYPIYQIKRWNYALILAYEGHPGDGAYSAAVPGVQTLTMDDGRSYYYVIEKDDPYYGAYSVVFWDESTFVYRFETSEVSILRPEEFMRVLESMVRVESRGSV